MEKQLVSVVIPCFNQGKLIDEALESLKQCDPSAYEVIIVNDGSTDEYTNTRLSQLKAEGYKVIFQENKGLGGARNVGIKAAVGNLILPLDADNKIYPGYINECPRLFDLHPEIAVIYGNGKYFGEKQGVFKPGPFSLQKLMIGNFIDACALVRKSVIEEVGYYDEMKIMGLEDWDLWLRIGFRGYSFHYKDEVLFDYRVAKGSMISQLNKNIARQNEIESYFKNKYAGKLDFEFVNNYFIGKIKRKPFSFFYRLLFKKFFPGKYERLIREHKIYNGWLYD